MHRGTAGTAEVAAYLAQRCSAKLCMLHVVAPSLQESIRAEMEKAARSGHIERTEYEMIQQLSRNATRSAELCARQRCVEEIEVVAEVGDPAVSLSIGPWRGVCRSQCQRSGEAAARKRFAHSPRCPRSPNRLLTLMVAPIGFSYSPVGSQPSCLLREPCFDKALGRTDLSSGHGQSGSKRTLGRGSLACPSPRDLEQDGTCPVQ